MFLPIGDEPNSSKTPWVTYALIAINLLVWFVLCVPKIHEPLRFSTPGAIDYIDTVRRQMGLDQLDMLGRSTAFDLFIFTHGYRPAAPDPRALVTSMFLHGSWLHVFFNMLFLYIFGDNVEARLGAWRYLLVYLGTGAAATLAYAALYPTSSLPLVGASGAISGILGCYFIWFPRNRVHVLYPGFLALGRMDLPARWMLLIYLVLNNVLPLLFPHGASKSGVAYVAHLGGFFAGALYAFYVASNPKQVRVSHANDAHRTPPTDDVFERSESRHGFHVSAQHADIERLIAAQRFAEAIALFRALPARERVHLPAESIFALADALTVEKRYDEALQMLRPYCGPKQPQQDVRARAHLRMGLVYLRGLEHAASAYPHLLDALALGTGTRVAEAAHLALQDIEQPKRDPWARR